MLIKRRLLISTLLSTVMVTNALSAQTAKLDCKNGGCYVNVKNFKHSKNIPSRTTTFKRTPQATFMKPLISEQNLKVTHQEPNIETFNLASKKYIQQENEILEPLTEEEARSMVLAPNKYVMSPEELEIYNEQQSQLGINMEDELIEHTLPMSLYYCRNRSEPIYDEKLHLFQCLI